MRFLRTIAVVIHTLIFVIFGLFLISLAFNFFSSDEVAGIINYIYTDPNLKVAVACIGAIFILGGLLNAHINLGKIQMEKTIAFENPEGQVTVSLQAIEDFVKKSVRRIPEVRELRSNVTASKKGINIICKATLLADSNIPETTEKIQSMVKSKVRDMLGVEETINIKIHVNKISSKGKTEVPQAKEPEVSRRMPFGGNMVE